jgi:hypothetical protein
MHDIREWGRVFYEDGLGIFEVVCFLVGKGVCFVL